MKNIGIFLGILGILGIGYILFAVAVITVKIFIGLAVLALISTGFIIGRITK